VQCEHNIGKLKIKVRAYEQVGYAFVNFTSLQSLYDFIHAKVGKRWNLFSSDKVLQVSYDPAHPRPYARNVANPHQICYADIQ
jgi:hypothetical protein